MSKSMANASHAGRSPTKLNGRSNIAHAAATADGLTAHLISCQDDGLASTKFQTTLKILIILKWYG